MLCCKKFKSKNLNGVISRNIGFQRAVSGAEDKKMTLRQVITAANLEKKSSQELTNKQNNAPRKKYRKKGKLLGKGNFVDTRFVTGTGEVCNSN